MPKYDHHQHVLSDWLAEMDQRFQLGEVGEDTNKITWCQLLIAAMGSSILSSLEEEATWEDAKEALPTHLGIGSVRDEAWAALKNLKKGSKDIVELAGEAGKLAKRLQPRDKEASERHAVDAFLGALDRTLAAEVQKLGYKTIEDVVAAARRIEKILDEQMDTKMERLVSTMQEQIRLLKKDLTEANKQIAAHGTATPPVAAMAAVPAPAAATAAAAQPPPTAQAPPTRHVSHNYGDEVDLPRLPRCRIGCRPPRCFLCDEEGHVAANCPAHSILQRLLRQQARTNTHDPPQGSTQKPPTAKNDTHPGPKVQLHLLEWSPEAKVTPVGCTVGPPITGQLNLEGIPVLGLVDTGASVNCIRFSMWWQFRTQWGSLKPFEGVVHGAHGKPLQIAGKTQHLNLQWGEARGRASFIVIVGLESPPVLIGMDIMRPLRVRIDVTNGTATPTQPDPQTIHLNAAQTQDLPPNSHTLLLQAVDISAETALLVHCHNPWPSEDVYFCPEEGLPTFVSGVHALTSGFEVWVAIHNHRPEPLRMHTGQTVGTLEVVAIADAPPPPTASKPRRPPPVPKHLSSTQQQQLKDLFQEFSDIVSQGEDDLGCTPLLKHTIKTDGPPLRQQYHRQNPAVRREEMAQVQEMLSNGVIYPSNSLWASPVIMVKKKDGSLRFCVHFMQLNAATVKDAHPIPRIDDLLDALHGARWLSTLDLKSGYWQVPIQERDKKTAFRTNSGQLFEFNHVPFGLCNDPVTFSRLMDRIFAGLHWKTCLFYLDDIIVFAPTWEEHLARLRQVFKRLRHAKLKLGADKCTFVAREVSYLGHRVAEEGLRPDPALLAAIREISLPQNATEVCYFLGLAGYYRSYVKTFAAIAGPLHALTRKDAVFDWNTDCQDTFDGLKTLVTTSPITVFPDFSLPFRLYTDASTAGFGAILAQVKEGKERIICCASRSLNQAEKAYPATKLECLAIVRAVAKFRPYLMSIPFEVYTDHYALQWLKTMRTGSALLHRWSAALEEYDFTVKHRPGKSQTHVDGLLSRLPVDPPPPEDTLLQVRVLNDEDEAQRIARELHTATHLGGHALWKLFHDQYTHKAGCCICLETAQSCPQCQLGTDYGHRQKTTGTIQSQGPSDTLSIDIVGPLPPDHRHEFLIVFVDCYSKYTILIPSSNHTANTLSEALMRHVIPYFGTPRRSLSDREFISAIWNKLLRSLGIQQVLTSPYQPEGNAINERSHRILNNMLRARLLEGPSAKAWVDKVPGIMLTLNTIPHEPLRVFCLNDRYRTRTNTSS